MLIDLDTQSLALLSDSLKRSNLFDDGRKEIFIEHILVKEDVIVLSNNL